MCAKCKGKNREVDHHEEEAFWLLDSGASRHYTNRMSDFHSYRKFETPEYAGTADNKTVMVCEGAGTVIVEHSINHPEARLARTILRNVRYSPNIYDRIISMITLTNQGLIAHITKNLTIFEKNGKAFLEGYPRNVTNVYFWQTQIISTSEANNISVVNELDYEILHKRLGHPSNDVL
jgi:hypothetical protein